MGFIKKAVRVAKVVTNTDIKITAECAGCGKTIRGAKKGFCSTTCANFYTVGKWGQGNY